MERLTDRVSLTAIVGIAFVARAIALWLTRPEFVGWFNHSYYYWVQVKGLLATGRLPYEDLPFTFYIYGAMAGLLQVSGQDLEPSIVNAARLTMSIAPALIALPVYLIAKRINDDRPLGRGQWLLVCLSAFLPLTFAHMPELLQKNTLGLLLISAYLYRTYELIRYRSVINLVAVVALFVLISLTHLGTLAVTLLLGLSILLATLCSRFVAIDSGKVVLLLATLSIFGIGAIYILDADAFGRIVRYSLSSLPNSLTGMLFSSPTAAGKLLALAGIVVPLVVVYLLLRVHTQFRKTLLPVDRIFWLGNIFLAYALVLPIFDLDIVPRFILFMPLPLLVILNYHLRCNWNKRMNSLLVGLASVGIVLMLVGETMGLIRLYPDKNEMHQELVNVKADHKISEDDFVLTSYGANPACNWFLGSKSGLITAFNRRDWNSYDRVFVLNTLERRATSNPDSSRRTFRTAREKFEAMRQDIPLPANLQPRNSYEFFEFHELHAIPENWLFDQTENWIGWQE